MYTRTHIHFSVPACGLSLVHFSRQEKEEEKKGPRDEHFFPFLSARERDEGQIEKRNSWTFSFVNQSAMFLLQRRSTRERERRRKKDTMKLIRWVELQRSDWRVKLVSSRLLNGLAFCESTDLCQRFDRISTRESNAHYLTISEWGRDSFAFSVVPMHHFTVKSHQTRTAIIFDWRVGIVIRTSPPVSWR